MLENSEQRDISRVNEIEEKSWGRGQRRAGL